MYSFATLVVINVVSINAEVTMWWMALNQRGGLQILMAMAALCHLSM